MPNQHVYFYLNESYFLPSKWKCLSNKAWQAWTTNVNRANWHSKSIWLSVTAKISLCPKTFKGHSRNRKVWFRIRDPRASDALNTAYSWQRRILASCNEAACCICLALFSLIPCGPMRKLQVSIHFLGSQTGFKSWPYIHIGFVHTICILWDNKRRKRSAIGYDAYLKLQFLINSITHFFK